MCNNIHKEHTVPKRKSGKGWKLFSSRGSLVWGFYYRSRYADEWIHWDDYYRGDGFCFFFTKKEAERALREWNKITINKGNYIHRISYENALCRQKEDKFITGETFEIGLCKSFKKED
jgi:hypothetical protein